MSVHSRWNCSPTTRPSNTNAWLAHAALDRAGASANGRSKVSPCHCPTIDRLVPRREQRLIAPTRACTPPDTSRSRDVVASHGAADDLGKNLRAEADAQNRPAGGDRQRRRSASRRGATARSTSSSAAIGPPMMTSKSMSSARGYSSSRASVVVSSCPRSSAQVGDGGRTLEGHVLDDVNAHGWFPSIDEMRSPADDSTAGRAARRAVRPCYLGSWRRLRKRFPRHTGDAGPNGYYHDAMFIAHPMVSATAPPTDEGVRTCTW